MVILLVSYKLAPDISRANTVSLNVTTTTPPTNVSNPILLKVYQKSNVNLMDFLDYAYSSLNSSKDINLTYSGTYNETDYYYGNFNKGTKISANMPLNIAYEKLNNSYKFYFNTSGTSEFSNFSMMIIKNIPKSYFCVKLFSNSDICLNLNKANTTSVLDYSKFDNMTISGIKSTKYNGKDCYLVKSSGILSNNSLDYVYYKSNSCLSYKTGLPLNLSLFYSTDNKTIDEYENDSIYINSSTYGNNANYNFISYLPSKPINITPTNTSTNLNITKHKERIYNCSNFSFTSNLYNTSYNKTCEFKGGFMNISMGSGNSGYLGLSVIGDNGKIYYAGSTNYRCLSYIKSVYAPKQTYSINIRTGPGGGSCGNSTLYIS